jgi:hypothetical protein
MARGPGPLLSLIVLVGVATAYAQNAIPRGPILVPGGVPNPGYCWAELKLFDTLRYGPFDFCRKRLAYRPGGSSARRSARASAGCSSAGSGRSRARRTTST